MAERLVTALVNVLNIPIQLHCHASSGMAVPSYVEGVRAGAGAIDCAIASMSGFSSLPPVETLLTIFSETHYSARLDIDALGKVNKYFWICIPSVPRPLRTWATSIRTCCCTRFRAA
jgi:oxaloacetate decarboxylase alpha subunit